MMMSAHFKPMMILAWHHDDVACTDCTNDQQEKCMVSSCLLTRLWLGGLCRMWCVMLTKLSRICTDYTLRVRWIFECPTEKNVWKPVFGHSGLEAFWCLELLMWLDARILILISKGGKSAKYDRWSRDLFTTAELRNMQKIHVWIIPH